MTLNTHIPKFRRFVLQNFPFIEQDFDALTDYELICKVIEYLNQVITSQNEVINELTSFETNVTNEINTFETNITTSFNELQALFEQLQSFVNNYFDNLDVQDEINTKLEDMVEDGTLASLISTQILGNLSNLKTANKTTIVDAVNEVWADVGISVMDKYRKAEYSHWTEVTLPEDITDPFFDNFTIYANDARNYYVEFDRSKFINNSAHTYYISPTGNNTTGDGTENNPWATIYEAWKHCTSGDTIFCKNGLYPRQGLPNSDSTRFTHSINLIGESKDGVWFKEADNHEWTQDSTYTNLYHTTRSGVSEVIDISERTSGKFAKLTEVFSITDCASTPNTFFRDVDEVYVNLNGITVSDDNILLGLGLGNTGAFRFENFTGDTLIYLKNINVLQGDRGIINCNNNTNHTVTVYMRDCKFYNNRSGDYTLDAMSNKGCYTICENVVANNSKKDGFNYHKSSTNKEGIGIEINCTSINCGYGWTDSGKLSNNSTTAHNGSQVVRVNGVYGFCNGGCAVDIDTVVSAFYGCTIFDSYGRSYDLYAGGTATMYVYDCYFKGSKANENLKSNEESHVYYNSGTAFDTKAGPNVILIQ